MMDKVDATSALLAAKANKTEIPEDVRKQLKGAPEGAEGEEIDERVEKDAEAICKRFNERYERTTQSAKDDEEISEDASATKDAFKKWMKRTNKIIEKNANGRRLKGKYVTMFLNGNTPSEAAEKVLRKYMRLREERKKGILALLDSTKDRASE